MIFGGKGRIVALKSIERTGRAAFSFGVNKIRDGKLKKTRSSRYIYLHKPKGSDKLEIIR
ncbi:hypothetical protein Q4517_12890 [Tenacibaculum sp. 1_MG-2023]|uniref:hypothetical protein n=1 Tax=Tenacibaculum sp. 1_MG-2023 TaxID=3062653 RepID=UPI0026E16E41|nr:hypothetical protein [Tenacibaculum sp. 1_MG-2023]MDO6676441.1 hypothetical protein [Tenacibaculum sp. 1_MG-2023]